MSTKDICAKCGQPLEYYSGIGWVSTINGDEGGTYDLCEELTSHTPERIN